MTISDAIDTSGEPYPGLRSFHRDETHIFFGREGTIAEMVDRLGIHRFLAVTGLSGSGKSSLVRTGLLNALERGLLVEAGSDWRVADFRPGGRSLSHLTTALVEAIGGDYSGEECGLIEAKLARGPLGLVEWLDEIEFPEATNLLLLADQFEEIFRYREGRSSDEGDAFVALLLASAKQKKRRIYVVITMRSDFLGDCARFTDLAETINEGQFLTPRLTREQCREAIEGPAAVYGGQVEPALVTRMLNDMGGNPDQLPLMQHILMLLWQQACKRAGDLPPELTLAEYERLGGIGTAQSDSDIPVYADGKKSLQLPRPLSWLRRKFATPQASPRVDCAAATLPSNGALSDHADRVLAGLTSAQQRLAAILFRALTQSEGARGRDIRRPTTLATIAAIAEVPIADLVPIIDEFRGPGRDFLTPPNPTPLGPDSVIDISHESLIRQWVKLRQWVRDEYQSAEEYRSIERAAKQWSSGLGNLLMKLDLAVARKWRKTERPNAPWAERYGNAFGLAMTFLRKSERHSLWRRWIAAVSASAVIVAILSTATAAVFLMAIVTTGLSYVNPADEWSDFGVAAQSVLKENVGTNTPLAIPGGRVIGTAELHTALDRGTLDGVPFLLINALRGADKAAMIPGSIYVEYAGDYGTFEDTIQGKLKGELAKRTDANLDRPLVFYCAGQRCWESYNAALRAINLGYSKVYWYRGGIAAWREADQQRPLDLSNIPYSWPAIGAGIRAVQEALLPNADYYYRRGIASAKKRQAENAIADFTTTISLAPNNAAAYLERARVYVGREDYEKANGDFLKAAALDSRIGPADDYASGGAYDFYDKRYDKAITEFGQAIKLDPKNAARYHARGVAYYAKGDHAHAIDDYTQAIALDAKNAALYDGRGDAYYAKGDYAHAIDDYTQAIALDAKKKAFFVDRGTAYYRAKNYMPAIADFTQAIQLDPENIDYYSMRGAAYAASGDQVHGLEDNGTAYYRKGQFAEAIMAYDQLIMLEPKHPKHYNDRGDAKRASGDLDGALADYEMSVAIAKSVLATASTKADAARELEGYASKAGGLAYNFLLKNDFAKALRAADESVGLAPELIWLYINRAHALMFLGRLDEARALYLQYRGRPDVQNGKSWDAVVLTDFAEMRQAGLMHPLMGEIEKQFAAGG
jgi:PQQ-dependent catabolism-associated CXXCW motif protein